MFRHASTIGGCVSRWAENDPGRTLDSERSFVFSRATLPPTVEEAGATVVRSPRAA